MTALNLEQDHQVIIQDNKIIHYKINIYNYVYIYVYIYHRLYIYICIHKCHKISAARLGPLGSTFGKRSVEVFVLKWKSNAHF